MIARHCGGGCHQKDLNEILFLKNCNLINYFNGDLNKSKHRYYDTTDGFFNEKSLQRLINKNVSLIIMKDHTGYD